MKITDMRVRVVAIPMNAQLRHNTGVHPGYLLRNIVEIFTDEGIVGERYDENGNWCGNGKITPPKSPKTKPVELTNKEIMLVREALDCYGDEVADSQGYTSGEKYWNLMHKFSTDKK